MVVKILYTKDSPQQSDILRFAEELKKHQAEVRLVDADTGEGEALSDLYDLLGRPAVAVTREDGQLVQAWQNQLPPVAEVSYFAHQ